MKFVQLASSLKEGLSPIYLIDGDEAYFRDHAVKSISAACALSQPTLNDVRLDNVKDLSSLTGTLRCLPFFDEKRIVRLTEFYPTEREWESYLKEYAENPSSSTILLIVNSGKKAGAADLKKKKGVTHVDCSKEGEEALTRWLFGLMRKEGLQPEADAVGLMVRYTNCDAARLKLETEKLKALFGAGGRITRAVVEENIPKDTEYKIYELTQAASKRNSVQFYEILSDLLSKGFDENAVLTALVSHYKALSEVADVQGTDAEVGKRIGMHPYVVKKNRETLARLGRARVEELYRELYLITSGLRSGFYTKSGALYTATQKIFFGEEKR